jgi:hypothetical protein
MRGCSVILDLDKLLFRRQFILGPYFVERLKLWKKIKINDSIFLTVHPDLQLCQTTYKNKSLTLLGYILDPNNPQHNDLDIINSLIRQIEICDDFFNTENLGGRWIIILDDGKEVTLFNDATGLRQVFYTSNTSQAMWCASQPGIIAEELNLQIDKDALNNFIDSPQFKYNIEYWWPGDSSPFKEIKHLLPNHCLHLKKGICRRYWPNKSLSYLSLEEGVKKSSEILQGLINSAFNRFDLACTLTAGWDTRVLLAASKDISESIFYYTLIYYDLTEDSPDVKIPSQLLSQLGLKHNIIKCPSSYMDNEFKEIYKRNVTTAHDAWSNIAQGTYEHYPQNKVCVKGNASEIARCFYYASANIENVNAEKLARLTEMDKNSFAIKYFEKWLSEAREIGERYNINILDLFYWEQRMGSWQAQSQLEMDIAQEVFTPFNCRNLLTIMLSVEEKYRKPPDYKFYKKLIINLWPQTLMKPINPPIGLKSVIIRLLMRLKLYPFIKLIYNRFVAK